MTDEKPKRKRGVKKVVEGGVGGVEKYNIWYNIMRYFLTKGKFQGGQLILPMSMTNRIRKLVGKPWDAFVQDDKDWLEKMMNELPK